MIRLRDSQKKSDLKFRTYLEAERTCKSLKPIDALAEVENLETKFSIPVDHLMFFLVDENLITIDRPTSEEPLADGASAKIYPFWTQGTIEPGAMSLFKLDSMAGYLVGKVYTTGYMFGFSDLEKIPERQNVLRTKIAALETKLNEVQRALLRENEQEDYLREAHQKQIEKISEKIRDLRRELTILTVDREGLELHCVAGSRLEASHFQGPLSGQLMEMASGRTDSE